MPRGVRGSVADHGTITRYTTHGCRCAECRAAVTRYYRERNGALSRAEYDAARLPAHGTEGRYIHHGCRCAACKGASADARRRRRARVSA